MFQSANLVWYFIRKFSQNLSWNPLDLVGAFASSKYLETKLTLMIPKFQCHWISISLKAIVKMMQFILQSLQEIRVFMIWPNKSSLRFTDKPDYIAHDVQWSLDSPLLSLFILNEIFKGWFYRIILTYFKLMIFLAESDHYPSDFTKNINGLSRKFD